MSYFWVAAQAPQKPSFYLLLMVGWNPGFRGKLGWLTKGPETYLQSDDVGTGDAQKMG